MILFVSDIHFDPDGDPDAERDLARCLEAARTQISGLFLLGDIFDAYVEYRTLVPKGAVRLMGVLARLTDDGVPVSYVVGNHDPWHRDFFARHLGVDVRRISGIEHLAGNRVWVGHGDIEERGGMTLFRRFTRSSVVHRLYAGVLPGDSGQRLAAWVSRRYKSRRINPSTIAALHRFAEEKLASGEVNVVVLGHSHAPAVRQYPGGTYVNTGSWTLTRTLAVLDDSGARLRAWDGSRLIDEPGDPDTA